MFIKPVCSKTHLQAPDSGSKPQWNRDRRFLGWNFVPPHQRRLPACRRRHLRHLWPPRPAILMILIFAAGTAIACSAHAFPQLLAGRAVQGVGAGGIFAMLLAIFTDIVPLRLRPRYWAAIQAAWAVGTVTGPVIGGACAHPETWRWIFYINFPMCAVSLVAVPLLYKPRGTSGSFSSKWRQLDIVGCVLFLGSTTSFLIGITWGGVQYEWDSVQVLAPVFIGLAGIVLTVAWEKQGAKNPFLRLWIFEDFGTTAAYLCGMLQGLIVRQLPPSVALLTLTSSSSPKPITSQSTSKASSSSIPSRQASAASL